MKADPSGAPSAGERVMCRTLRTMAAVTAMAIAAQLTPVFAEIQELSIKFIGQSSIESNSAQLEKPFFPQMTEKSGNKIKVDLQPFNTLGLTGAGGDARMGEQRPLSP